MKTTCFIFCLIPILLFGQNPKYGCLNISSPSGASFFLYLNNQKINETPQIKVRVEHMYKYVYNAKIEFADSTRLSVQRNKLFICNKSGVFRDFYYDVVKENNVAKLVFKSMPAVLDIVSEKDVFVYDYDNSTSAPNLVESKNNDSIIKSIEKSDDVKKTIKDELLKSKEIVEYLNKNLITTIKDTNNIVVDKERYEKRNEYF